jgi:hypothetical protein
VLKKATVLLRLGEMTQLLASVTVIRTSVAAPLRAVAEIQPWVLFMRKSLFYFKLSQKTFFL